MINKNVIFLNCCLWFIASMVGFNVGHQVSSENYNSFSREPQNVEIAHDFDSIPCPSQRTYNNLKQKYNISADPPKFKSSDPSDLCSKKSNKAVLAKSLVLLESLKLENLPGSWSWGAKPALEDPGKYFQESTPRVFYDFSRKTTVAYNVNSNNNIALCPRFFKSNNLLSNALTLVHEARHSDPIDRGHVKCRQGDLTARSGGCDELFRIDSRQGSYAYANVSYTYGLAKYSKLSSEQKSKLKSRVLWFLANRFNQVPATLAAHADIVYVLSDRGNLFVLHPFMKKLLRSPVQFPNSPESIFYTRRGELFGFSNTENPWRFSPVRKTPANMYRKSLLDGQHDIKFMNYLSYASGKSRNWYFLTQNDEIHLIKYNSERDEHITLKSTYQPRRNQAFKYLFNANSNRRYGLDNTGNLYLLESSETPKRITRSKFQAPGNSGWVYATGDVIMDSLYGVSSEGVLYYWGDSEVKRSVYRPPTNIKKFQEMTSMRGSLSTDNKISILLFDELKDTSNMKYSEVNLSDLGVRAKDFALATTAWTKIIDFKPHDEFKRRCSIVKTIRGPWLEKDIGIDTRGRLVFEGNSREPCLIANNSQLRGKTITHLWIDGLAHDREKSSGFGAVQLKVRTRGNSVIAIKPYSY